MKAININNKTYNNPLLVFAMKEEAQSFFGGFSLLFTGLGKVNASYALTKNISSNFPDIIINLGTAGSTQFLKGEVICCTQFVQRDMDVEALGFPKFKTPFAEEEAILSYGIAPNDMKIGICGSGDSFETEHNNPEYNVVDMEAYALALIAKRENIPFLCLKYISDGADKDAVDDWSISVTKAAQTLKSALGIV